MDNQTINKELDQVKSDLADLRADMAILLKAVKESAVEQGREKYDHTYEQVRHTGEKIKDQAEEAYSAISKGVEERPFASVLASLATGFVVGMLLNQRRH